MHKHGGDKDSNSRSISAGLSGAATGAQAVYAAMVL